MVFEQRMEKHRKCRGVHSALDLGLSPDPPLTNWLMTVKFLDSSVTLIFLFVNPNLCFWRGFNK